MIALGVNIDHVATVRQARGTTYPSPVEAALVAEVAGADAITLHLREDRRHIQENDVVILRDRLKTRMNLESAVTEAIKLNSTSLLFQKIHHVRWTCSGNNTSYFTRFFRKNVVWNGRRCKHI